MSHDLVLLRHALPGIQNKEDDIDRFHGMLRTHGGKIIQGRIDPFPTLKPRRVEQAVLPGFVLSLCLVVQIELDGFASRSGNIAHNQALRVQKTVA